MKKIPLLILLPFLSSIFISCSEDKEADPLAKLPAISQTGANTFGCLVDGQVFYPRDERVGALFSPSPMNGVEIYGSPKGQEYTEFYGSLPRPISSEKFPRVLQQIGEIKRVERQCWMMKTIGKGAPISRKSLPTLGAVFTFLPDLFRSRCRSA